MITMKDFLTNEQELAVVEEIRSAESKTSGEIRVVITSRWILFPERHARKLFASLGMHKTHHRNGALLVIFNRRRKFVVLGDDALHHHVGAEYWKILASDFTRRLREGRKLDALIHAIRTLGTTLAEKWPPGDENPDELSNEIHRE
jgi:uncharacterized membrane protein